MPRLTKAQRNIQYKDNTINNLVSRAQEDSKAQAEEVARLYKEGKFRNWLTAKNLLTRFAEGTNRSRLFARKKVDGGAKDWDRYRVKDPRKIELAKNREKVAVSKITTKFKQFKFRQQRIVDNVEVGEKPDRALHHNIVRFKLNKAYTYLPESDEDGEYKIRIVSEGEPHPDSVYENVAPKMKAVVLELVKKMLTQEGSFKLVIALNSILYKTQEIDPSHFKRLGMTKKDDMIEQTKWKVRPKTKAVETNKNNVEPVINSLFDQLGEQVDDLADIKGSNWAFKKFVSMEITRYATRKERGSSYIPTPEKFNNSRRGLIYIKP